MSSIRDKFEKDFRENRERRAQNSANYFNNGKLSDSQKSYINGDYKTTISNRTYGYSQGSNFNGVTQFTGGRSKSNYDKKNNGENPYNVRYYKPSIKTTYKTQPYKDKYGNVQPGFYTNKKLLTNDEKYSLLTNKSISDKSIAKARDTRDRQNSYSIMRSYDTNAKNFVDTLNTPKLDGIRVARNKGGGLNYLVGGAKDFLADPIVDFLKLIDAPESALMSGALGLVDTGVDLLNVPFGNRKLSEVNWDSARESFNKSLDSSRTTGWGDSASEGLKKINESYQENEIREAQRMGYDVDAIRRRQQENKAKVDTFMTFAGAIGDVLNPIDVGGKAVGIGKGMAGLAKKSKNAGIISDPEIYETFSKLADRVENISKGNKKNGLGMDLQTLAKKPETQETAEFLSDIVKNNGVKVSRKNMSKKYNSVARYVDDLKQSVKSSEEFAERFVNRPEDVWFNANDYLKQYEPDLYNSVQNYLELKNKGSNTIVFDDISSPIKSNNPRYDVLDNVNDDLKTVSKNVVKSKSPIKYNKNNYKETVKAIEHYIGDDNEIFKVLDNIDNEDLEDKVFDYVGEKYPDLLDRYLGNESSYADKLIRNDTTNPLNDLIDAHKNKQIDYVDESGNVVDTLNKQSNTGAYALWSENIRQKAKENQARTSNLTLVDKRNSFNTYIGRYISSVSNPKYISKTGLVRYDDTINELTKLRRANISASEKARYLNEILFKGETVISPSINKQTVKNILDIFIDINKSAKGIASGTPIENLSEQSLKYLKYVYKTDDLPTEINPQTIFSDLKKMSENYADSYVDKSYWDKIFYKDEKLGKNAVKNAYAQKSKIYKSGKVSPELTKELQRLQSIIDEGKRLDLEIDDLDDFDEYLKTNNVDVYNKLIEKRKADEVRATKRRSHKDTIKSIIDELYDESSNKRIYRDDTPESILKSIKDEFSPEDSSVKFLDSDEDIDKFHRYKAKPLQYEADMKHQQRLLNYQGDDINSYKGNEEFLLNSQETQEMLNYEKLMKEREPRFNKHIDENGERISFSVRQTMEHPDAQHNVINYIKSLERELKEFLSKGSVGKLGYKSNRHTSAQNDYLDAIDSFNNTIIAFKNSDFNSYRSDIIKEVYSDFPNLRSSVGDKEFYKYVSIKAKEKYIRELYLKYSSLYETVFNHFPDIGIDKKIDGVFKQKTKIFDTLREEEKVAIDILSKSKKIENKSYKLQGVLKIAPPKFNKRGSVASPANIDTNKKNLWKVVINEVDMAKKNPELYKEYEDAFSFLRKQYFNGLKTQGINEAELENITNIVNKKLKEIPTTKQRNDEMIKDVFSKLKNKSNVPVDLQLLARKGDKKVRKVKSLDELDITKPTNIQVLKITSGGSSNNIPKKSSYKKDYYRPYARHYSGRDLKELLTTRSDNTLMYNPLTGEIKDSANRKPGEWLPSKAHDIPMFRDMSDGYVPLSSPYNLGFNNNNLGVFNDNDYVVGSFINKNTLGFDKSPKLGFDGINNPRDELFKSQEVPFPSEDVKYLKYRKPYERPYIAGSTKRLSDLYLKDEPLMLNAPIKKTYSKPTANVHKPIGDYPDSLMYPKSKRLSDEYFNNEPLMLNAPIKKTYSKPTANVHKPIGDYPDSLMYPKSKRLSDEYFNNEPLMLNAPTKKTYSKPTANVHKPIGDYPDSLMYPKSKRLSDEYFNNEPLMLNAPKVDDVPSPSIEDMKEQIDKLNRKSFDARKQGILHIGNSKQHEYFQLADEYSRQAEELKEQIKIMSSKPVNIEEQVTPITKLNDKINSNKPTTKLSDVKKLEGDELYKYSLDVQTRVLSKEPIEELKVICKKLGVTDYSNKSKKQLIDMIDDVRQKEIWKKYRSSNPVTSPINKLDKNYKSPIDEKISDIEKELELINSGFYNGMSENEYKALESEVNNAKKDINYLKSLKFNPESYEYGTALDRLSRSLNGLNVPRPTDTLDLVEGDGYSNLNYLGKVQKHKKDLNKNYKSIYEDFELSNKYKDEKEFYDNLVNFDELIRNYKFDDIYDIYYDNDFIDGKASQRLAEKYPKNAEYVDTFGNLFDYRVKLREYIDSVIHKKHPLDDYDPLRELSNVKSNIWDIRREIKNTVNSKNYNPSHMEGLIRRWDELEGDGRKLQKYVDTDYKYKKPTKIKKGHRHIDRQYNEPDVNPYSYRFNDDDNELFDDALEIINRRDDIPVDYDYYDSRGVDYVPENFIDPDNPNIIYVHDKFGRRKPIYKTEGNTPEEIMIDKYNKLYPNKPYLQDLIETGKENLLRDNSADKKLPWEIEEKFEDASKNVIIDTKTGEVRPTEEALRLNAIKAGRFDDYMEGKNITTPSDFWMFDYKQANAFVDYMRNESKMKGEDYSRLLSEFNITVDKEGLDSGKVFNRVKDARKRLKHIEDKHPEVATMTDDQYKKFIKDKYNITINKNTFRTVSEATDRMFYFVGKLQEKGLIDRYDDGTFALPPFAEEFLKSDVFLSNPLSNNFYPSPFSEKAKYYDYITPIKKLQEKFKGKENRGKLSDAVHEYKKRYSGVDYNTEETPITKLDDKIKTDEDVPVEKTYDYEGDLNVLYDALQKTKDPMKQRRILDRIDVIEDAQEKGIPISLEPKKPNPPTVDEVQSDNDIDDVLDEILNNTSESTNQRNDSILSKLSSKFRDSLQRPFDFINPPVEGKSWYENNDAFDLYKRWLNTYKRGVTLYNPGWHVANFLQNKAQNYYGLGKDAFKSQRKASKMLDAIQGKSAELPDIITKDGVKIDSSDVMNYAIDNEIVDGLYEDVKSAPKTIFSNFDKRMDDTKLMQFLARNEQTARLHHFITQIENGKSFEDAHKSVNKYLFDYSKKGEADKFMENFIDPFWTFHKNSARLAGEASLRNPHRMGNILRAERDMQNGVDEEDRNNNASETNYQLPYGSYVDSGNGDRYDMMYKQNMFITPTNTFPGDFASIEGKMNPLLKLAIQQYRGKGNWDTDVVEGKPGFNEISKDEKKREVVANVNPVLNNFFTNLNKSKSYDERSQSLDTKEKQKLMVWLNYVTGGKFNYQRNIDWQ